MQCQQCQTISPDNAKFCEICGARLIKSTGSNQPSASVPPLKNCRCGAPAQAIDEQGYCLECGLKREKNRRDHYEASPEENFAAVTDRGKRHSDNEDDFAIAIERVGEKIFYIIVVSDGVSSSQHAAEAAARAARKACDSLSQAVQAGFNNVDEIIKTAIKLANAEVCAINFDATLDRDAPAATIVLALVEGRCATIGWLGDSRAYLMEQSGAAKLLTRDHSWLNDIIDSGELTESEIANSNNKHVITRCLGQIIENENDSDKTSDSAAAALISCQLPQDSCLMLCSDGFWNYVDSAEQIVQLTKDREKNMLDRARRLVDFALKKGGVDNVTVAMLAL